MRNPGLLLLLIALLGCQKDNFIPSAGTAGDVFVIGGVGGWGGSYALKLEQGKLFISGDRTGDVLERTLPEGTDWSPFGTEADRQAVVDLRADFPADELTLDNQRTRCDAAMRDNACPFVLLRTAKGEVAAWTYDPDRDDTSGMEYLLRASRLVGEITPP